MKKPYIEPEIEIESITTLNNFLVVSTPKGWEDTDGDEALDPEDPWN